VDVFLAQPWSYAYQGEDEMDTFTLEGLKPILPIENQGMYASVFCKFANVSPHRDTHDDEYYLLYVLSGQARLHVGSRKTESIDLTPGLCVLFNCDATHWAEGDSENPVSVIIGGVRRSVGRSILYAQNPYAVFKQLLSEAKNHDY
jgi:mannose-6-phosphate isomerase-like protein (cupin superfamily)